MLQDGKNRIVGEAIGTGQVLEPNPGLQASGDFEGGAQIAAGLGRLSCGRQQNTRGQQRPCRKPEKGTKQILPAQSVSTYYRGIHEFEIP
jgi:hypothetical protein